MMKKLAAMDAAFDRRWTAAVGGTERGRVLSLLIMQMISLVALFVGAGLDSPRVMGIAIPGVLWMVVELVRILPAKERTPAE